MKFKHVLVAVGDPGTKASPAITKARMLIAEKHAAIRGISLAELDAATTANACALFGIA